MIPTLRPLEATVRPLNDRLWQLVEKDCANTLTPAERCVLDLMFQALETEQDNIPRDTVAANNRPVTDK